MNSSKGKVLLIENEGIVALDIKDTLKKEGFVVKSIQYSKTELIKNVLNINPDFIILDLDGNFKDFETLDKLNNYYDLPVIFITGLTQKEFDSLNPVNRNIHLILKPFNSENLRTIFKKSELLKKKSAEEISGLNKNLSDYNSSDQIPMSI